MIPRSEYPRPQFARENWMNLNGEWEFEISQGMSGRAQGLAGRALRDKIIVPFCPESRLSGVGNTDFLQEVWYARDVELPFDPEGKRVFLHFGAVDYAAEVYVNGQSAGTHRGGYVGFEIEITGLVHRGVNRVVVCADDDTRDNTHPSGKQSERYASYGCSYTRTTGIWQTVWLEWTNEARIDNVRMTPDSANGALYLKAELSGAKRGMKLAADVTFEGKPQGRFEAACTATGAYMVIKPEEAHLWGPGEGNLYDVTLTLADADGNEADRVNTYFGLRTVELDGMAFRINGKSVFQRLVLDQGFYPDGIYTAPTDEELKNDILRSMAMGFNGARLHQKVFEQRFLYWADRLGYIVWGEMASWGCEPDLDGSLTNFLDEWLESVRRDYNSPAVIGWCPWNEVWGESANGKRGEAMRTTYLATKAADPTRPVIDTSGGLHAATDIYDTHDYEQDPAIFAVRYAPDAPLIYDRLGADGLKKQKYTGGPVFVSEYGGIAWNPDGEGWGYGNGPKSEEEFIERYRGLTNALLDNPNHLGFCYTQLTDVEQERNGLYYYDRRPKFDPDVIREITARKAKIE